LTSVHMVRGHRKSLGRKLGTDLRNNWSLYLMFLPILIWYIIFKYAPLKNLVISFMNYNIFKGISGSKWIGLENYVKFFQMENCWTLIRNTLLLSVYSIIFGFPAPIILALMLNEVRSKHLKSAIQTVSYMPHFISLVVVCGILQRFCATDGLFNQLRELLGLPGMGNLLAKSELYRTIHITSGIWQTAGWDSIIYLATLSGLDPSLYEAAHIDGAGRFQRIWHVTLPGLVPIISIKLIMQLGNLMSVGYEKIILLYNPLTYDTADVISSFLYRYGLQGGRYSMGTAIGLMNSVINIIILISVNRLFRKITEESLW